MPQIMEILEALPETFPNRKQFTREDCRFLVDNELLTGRWELIDGEIISKMGQKPPHRIVITLLMAYLTRFFDPLTVQIQGPVDVAPQDNRENEPEPDGIVLAKPTIAYPDGNPPPSAVRLVVEVSDSTLRFDLTRKKTRYARAGIVDYWVIDINGRRIIVHRDPDAAQGAYRQTLTFVEGETLAPLIAPKAVISVSDLLPPVIVPGG